MKSQFVTNYTKQKFLAKIKESLQSCDGFYFSVSFIKKAGLILLLNDIKEALNRGAVGKIITSTYQNFTDILSLEEFLGLMNKYSNFDCHLNYSCFGENGFHTKGYLFKYANSYELVVGSSNITRYALLNNIEWNLAVTTNDLEDHYRDALAEFEFLWSKTYQLNRDLINKYSIQLDFAIEKWDMDYIRTYDTRIVPNSMQKKALKEIRRFRDMGVKKALVVAATGSGKTYLAAFDALNFDAKRVLFVVHRDTILKEAMKTFAAVFRERVTYGLFMAHFKEFDRDFIFTTNTTMSRNLHMFAQDEFDYIIFDEVHHAVAETYKKIIDYFKPQFMLGLTATPERMDNESVFDLFDKNLPYELRLREALENDLVVPFRYFGINDSLLDYSEENPSALIKQIADDLHCEFIKENIEKHRPSGKLKAIGFCRSIEHARIMTEKMNLLGYHTTFLSGRSDTGERLKAFSDLQADDRMLEIIFTVDLLNEGVDIPAINMVLFLRPTESSTIFIQQLGRGLRKYESKEYLVVLDFIGNSYLRSVQIALALGTLSNNLYIDKRLLCEYVRKDFIQLNLPIEIHIDEISKSEIITAIEKTNFNNLQFLKQDYLNFKKYLGLDIAPKHVDFINVDNAIDLKRYIKKYGSYYNFLQTIDEDVPLFDENEKEFIKYLSNYIPLIRPYEYMIVKELLSGSKTKAELIDSIKEIVNYDVHKFEHALNNLQNLYFSDKEQQSKNKYLLFDGSKYSLLINLQNTALLNYTEDLLEYGLIRYEVEFGYPNEDLVLYANYSRIQFLQAICADKMTFREGIMWYNGQLYLFIDLKKDLSKEEWLLYEDKFLSSKVLQWESQTETTIDNSKGKQLISKEFADVFVRKIKSEDGISLPYIYIGKGQLTKARKSKNIKRSLLFDIVLEKEIPEYLRYDFEITDA